MDPTALFLVWSIPVGLDFTHSILDVNNSLSIFGYPGNTPEYILLTDAYFLDNKSSEATYTVYYDMEIEKTLSISHDRGNFANSFSHRFLLCIFYLRNLYSHGYGLSCLCLLFLMCYPTQSKHSGECKVSNLQFLMNSELSCKDKNGSNPFANYTILPRMNRTLNTNGMRITSF